MARQVFNVLEEEGFRAFLGQDSTNIEKKCSLSFVFESGGTTKAVLLGNAGDRERLARESTDENIVVWNILRIDLRNIVVRNLMEVGLIGFAAELIPFVAVDAFRACRFHRKAQASDAGKKIDEGVAHFYLDSQSNTSDI